MGSFLSVSKSQMDEIIAGVKSSGVRVFWVARGGLACGDASVYAGLPILTFVIFWDPIPNGKQIVEDWRIGYRVKKEGVELVVSCEEIAELVKKERAKQQEVCRGAIANGGSSDRNLDTFIKDISKGHMPDECGSS
ncbi:UDP-glycosyltransferase 87A1-like [Pyrus ussuriensis x Pyrus communis]|uniref:UDP-glycosyltransferase 87A1-like n=1 Tax=Pyrus ussuriensis x Pyrus communis TaxID=2448454 RepID=A0A5N5FM33_9ROSA|nr:UDP-glycosyltransferase 87A1-like [Pyrus ussuriensis x Pyrus communis]